TRAAAALTAFRLLPRGRVARFVVRTLVGLGVVRRRLLVPPERRSTEQPRPRRTALLLTLASAPLLFPLFLPLACPLLLPGALPVLPLLALAAQVPLPVPPLVTLLALPVAPLVAVPVDRLRRRATRHRAPVERPARTPTAGPRARTCCCSSTGSGACTSARTGPCSGTGRAFSGLPRGLHRRLAGFGLQLLAHGARRLAHLVADAFRQVVDRVADLALQRLKLGGARHEFGASGVGDLVDLPAAVRLVPHQALGLEPGQARVHRARARRVEPCETLTQLLDDLVAVPRTLVQQLE